ncbi:MAG: hypothetical protein DI542_02585 [Acinetobacter johnsonii]|jgi:ribosomal protein S28E/S33|uniref:Uncharacterized protein n=1 Tax=Acinetobacter johnsonii TaxID=40214 RepID=A0A2W5RWU9_ACIJO|nr:hypothetical protein [Acinetobacter johnsonii]MDH1726110.1 hypothetical protein [Acinetobacter johnsonii]PZQ93272.1 MAG: hypothetical protein DI542_02585 [Acinetobacter johnsonii]
MDKKTLVIQRDLSKDMEFSGHFLFKELIKKRINIDAAMWFFQSEINEWKYILVFDDFSEKGSSYLYEIISGINRTNISKKYKSIPLNYIEVKSKNSFIYRNMKGFIRAEDGMIRVTNSMVNGFEIYDCLIYRFI